FEILMHQIQSVDKICQNFIDKPDCFQLDNLNLVRDDFKILMKKLQREMKSLSVNKIKVSCFGRTSNGKSTLMNAILSKELIPTGLGQTTSCFISIEGTDSDELSAVLTTEGGEEIECDIKSIHDLSSAFSDSKTSFGSIIRIKYPKKLCPLLDSDIILYDSPGIDDSDVSDYYIKKYCLDSDIFFYVCNSESSLMKIEKDFFLSVYRKIAKPNIFVLFNRWDQCIDSKDSELLVKQHREKISELQYQLKRADASNLDNMIYFISSKHSLDSKINGNFEDGSVLNKNFKQFEDFLGQTIKSNSIS
ncbi:MAG: Mitofusin-1, partial [Marteilia pararefringens]